MCVIGPPRETAINVAARSLSAYHVIEPSPQPTTICVPSTRSPVTGLARWRTVDAVPALSTATTVPSSVPAYSVPRIAHACDVQRAGEDSAGPLETGGAT